MFLFQLHYQQFFFLKTETNNDLSCRVKTNAALHFFAFRTHAHALGKVISGYKVDNAVKIFFFHCSLSNLVVIVISLMKSSQIRSKQNQVSLEMCCSKNCYWECLIDGLLWMSY